MKSPTLEHIDRDRSDGFRPVVVMCFTYNQKILLGYKKRYNGWILPQGGIENKENPEESIVRETKEEIGKSIINNTNDFELFLNHRLNLSTGSKRKLKTDSGKTVEMIGKTYYFYHIQIGAEHPNFSGEFDEYKWANYDEAVEKTGEATSKKKKLLVKEALDILKESNIIS